MYCGLAGIVGTQGPDGYRWHKGTFRGSQGVLGPLGGVRGVLGAGRECRYSGTRRSIGGIRGIRVAHRGVGAIRGVRVWECQGV